jgi:PhnB protein
MMQVYAVGSREAAELYQKAFDATLVAEYPADDGNYYHAELNVYGRFWLLPNRGTARRTRTKTGYIP